MEFTEAKVKMEFGLVVLGYDDKEYKFITEQEWEDTSDNCTDKPHLLELPGRVCGSCKVFYIRDETLNHMTDKELVPVLDTLAGFFRNGELK